MIREDQTSTPPKQHNTVQGSAMQCYTMQDCGGAELQDEWLLLSPSLCKKQEALVVMMRHYIVDRVPA